jgi:hypothetical protein
VQEAGGEGGWRGVHNEGIHDLYSSPLIRTEHIARIRKGGKHTKIWWRFLRERENLEDLGVYRKIILKRTFKKYGKGRRHV